MTQKFSIFFTMTSKNERHTKKPPKNLRLRNFFIYFIISSQPLPLGDYFNNNDIYVIICHYVTLRVSIFFYHFFAPCQVTVLRLHMLEMKNLKKRIIKEKGKWKTYFIYNNKVDLIIRSGHAVLKINHIINLWCAFLSERNRIYWELTWCRFLVLKKTKYN